MNAHNRQPIRMDVHDQHQASCAGHLTWCPLNSYWLSVGWVWAPPNTDPDIRIKVTAVNLGGDPQKHLQGSRRHQGLSPAGTLPVWWARRLIRGPTPAPLNEGCCTHSCPRCTSSWGHTHLLWGSQRGRYKPWRNVASTMLLLQVLQKRTQHLPSPQGDSDHFQQIVKPRTQKLPARLFSSCPVTDSRFSPWSGIGGLLLLR